MFLGLIVAAVTFTVNPSDPDLRFDGYKVERVGVDFAITGARARSELYARYDEPQWRNLAPGAKFVKNPAFETRFLNVNISDRHGLTDYVAASGANLVQLGRIYGVSMEKTFPEVFAALSEESRAAHLKGKRLAQKSGAARVAELAKLDIPAYPLLYGCDAMKWDRELCEAFLKVYPSAKGTDPGRSWEKGVLCPSDPATARFVEAFVAEVAENAPYAGIVATFWDDYGMNCHCKRCRKNGNDRFGNQVAFTVRCYERALAKTGKRLLLRTWASGAAHWLGDEWVHAPGYGGPSGEPLGVWGRTIAGLAPSTIVQTKVYNSDCQPLPPFSLLLGEVGKAGKPNMEIAEWQITGQTLGLEWLPASVVEDTRERMLKARELVGPAGGVALYAGGYRNPGYDAIDDIANSVNLYAWRELSWNPDKPTAEIWNEWTARTFGRANKAVAEALALTEKATAASFSPLGLGASTESRFASKMQRREDLLRYTNRYYLPEGRAALAPTKANVEKVVAEKDAAIAAVDKALALLAEAELEPAAMDELTLRFKWLRTHLVVSKALDGALFRARCLRAQAMFDVADLETFAAIKADFDTIRAENKNLFAGAEGRKFSFYSAPAVKEQVWLGSPVGLMRDIYETALATVEHIAGAVETRK